MKPSRLVPTKTEAFIAESSCCRLTDRAQAAAPSSNVHKHNFNRSHTDTSADLLGTGAASFKRVLGGGARRCTVSNGMGDVRHSRRAARRSCDWRLARSMYSARSARYQAPASG